MVRRLFAPLILPFLACTALYSYVAAEGAPLLSADLCQAPEEKAKNNPDAVQFVSCGGFL